ncbi:MAG TPA: TIR domain-containing protein [Ktedonobacteraceae bacterium]
MSLFEDFLRRWLPSTPPEPEVRFFDLHEQRAREKIWQDQFEARRRARPNGLQLLLAIERNLDDPIALSPKGDFITSGARDATLRLWNPQTGEEVKRLQGHDSRVSSVAWSPSGRLVSGANDTTICVWEVHAEAVAAGNVSIEKPVLTLKGHSRPVTSVSWSSNGHWLASGAEDKSVRIWEASSQSALKVLYGHARAVRSVAWSADGRFLASAGDGGNIHIWDGQSGAPVRVISAHAGGMRCLAWSPTEKYLLASGGNDATVRLWDARTGRLVRRLEEHTQGVTGVSFSPDGRLLVSQSVREGAEACFFRVDTWETVAKLPINPFRASYPLAFQHDAPILLTGGDQHKDEVRIWKIDADTLVSGVLPSMQYSNAKVVLMGDSGVGKTGLFTVLQGEPFKPSDSTHGRHVHTLESQDVPVNERGQLDKFGARRERREILLWDLAGQPSYRVIHQLHLNEVAVALIVFDGRNEADPFAGVRHWDRALRQAQSSQNQAPLPLKKYLVAARVDRGGIGVSQERIEQFINEMDFAGYIETSAKEGTNVAKLEQLIKNSIEWEALPHVTSNELFEKIKSFLLQRRRAEQILSTRFELYHALLNTHKIGPDSPDLRAQFDRCIVQVEARDLLRRLSIGNLLLLQPELLDAYASALVNSVRDDPDGLGEILESKVKIGHFKMPSDARIEDKAQEEILLLAVIQDLLRYELALREETVEGTFLIFPSLSTRVNYDLPDPEGKALVFDFEGSIQNIYVTLAVRLSSSGLFARKEFWKDAITYSAGAGGTCGMFLQPRGDGYGRLTLFYDRLTTEETRFHFENFVEQHLLRRSVPGSVKRKRLFTCPEPTCQEPVPPSIVEKRRERGLNWLICSNCGTRVELADREERLTTAPLSLLLEMDHSADSRRGLSVLKATRAEEKQVAAYQGRQLEDFDVYLCYRDADGAAARLLASQLLEMNSIPWLDEWEVSKGENWQDKLAAQISSIGAAAVLVGNDPPPWDDQIVDGYLRRLARQGVVIPVILPECQNMPERPEYITRDWVDMRKSEPDPVAHLVQSIREK